MKICLVGNQNSGKTTLFNVLTGMNQKIGNWPGVTIEKKEGIIKRTNYTLVDLPGIYSLSSYSSEEDIWIFSFYIKSIYRKWISKIGYTHDCNYIHSNFTLHHPNKYTDQRINILTTF